MPVRLKVKQRGDTGGAGRDEELVLEDEAITIGRDRAAQVVLSQMSVSRAHARITRDGALYFVEDLGSAYGTSVNGRPLPKGEKRLLRSGDTIAIAQFDLVFDQLSDIPAPSTEKTSFIARSAMKDVMRGIGGGQHPYFRIMNGPREGHRIELGDAQELVVGREEATDVRLEDDLVSRRHAKLRRDWSGTHVEDLESRNGIKVNGKRVTRATLADRDELEIGSVRMLYLDPNEVREPPVEMDSNLDREISLPTPAAPMAVVAPAPEPVIAEAPPPPEPVPDPEPEPSAEIESAVQTETAQSPLANMRRFVPLAITGVLVLLALVFLILVIAGA